MADELFGMIKIFSRRKGTPTVRVSVFAIAAIIAFLAADFSVWTLLCLSAALLHETAHVAAALLCREKIDAVNIYPFGAEIRIKGGISSYAKDLVISSAGIAVNLLLFLVFFAAAGVHLKFFAAANLVLAAVNVIPARGLDGGRIAEGYSVHAPRLYACVVGLPHAYICRHGGSRYGGGRGGRCQRRKRVGGVCVCIYAYCSVRKRKVRRGDVNEKNTAYCV